MAAGKTGSHLLGNSAWNASAFLISVGLNLLVLPFVLFRLGASAFGVAGLVTACVAPALAFGNSLALSTTRELACRLAPGEKAEARRFFATALLLAGAAGVPIAATLSLAGPPLARHVFHLEGAVANDLGLAFLLGAGGWLCQCISGVFLALFTARQDYPRLASISMAIAVISTSSMLVLVPRWPQASTFLGCQALGFAGGLLVSCAISRRVAGEWMAGPALHRGPLGGLFNVGAWQFAAQGSGVIAGQADRYLLGAFLAPQFVGYYTIAQRLEEAMYIGILKIGEILFPFFSSLQKESSDRMADLLFRSSWVLNVLAATALGALIPIAGPLLQVWTGRDVAIATQGLLVVLAAAGMLGCASNVFAYYLLAQGRSRSTALIALTTAVVTLATSAVVLPHFGWQAAGWSACLGMIAQIVITMSLLRQSFGMPGMWPRVGHFVLLPLGTGIITATSLRYLVGERLFDQAPHWWLVGASYGAAAGIIFVVVVAVSGIGPYGETCWRDMRAIASRFLPGKVV
ncbi:lipopolysaccharide biosynthesis protein [Bradyrhizobium erythrophlei]|uniref:Membrane protein involved in the export of O-antigen and teichoic acid n=1 Tax=Bradyrhizobium erythrophlei TaxID=1437360 RepID=A0A1M5V9E3_9BRAD|nr:oligosaccharide flippase family protein [Bradyrhizobium erythrophlei]SHH71845.1 Membrane protein involved in the export of O-antigen and teichoic acid [Bradyrhizobium erythrophlei]